MFSSATTSGLGVVYWMLAARSYSTDTVGLNSAVISAMVFLANVAQLNLRNAMNRFIPRAGQATGRMVVYAYLISLAVSLVVSFVFLLGLDVWAPTLSFLGSSRLFFLWFALAIMAQVIFVLQDSVLVGLRQATWIPVENVLFALAKIVLLFALATSFPQYGVFASWTIPLIALLLPVNLLIFGRLIPRHVQATKDRAVPLIRAQIAKYVAGDYLSSLVWLATIGLMPIMVVERAGATANAHFYLSWTIAYSLYLVSRNMGMSLIAEAATDQTKLKTYSYRTLVQTARLLVPVVAILVIGAPYILRLFGDSYSTEGTTLLRLLCLSALPNMITSLYVSIARVQRRMVPIILVLTALCAIVMSLSYVLLGVVGISGVGVAWLVSQTVVATVLVLTQLRTVWLSRLDLRIVVRLLAVPRGVWWRWKSRRHVTEARRLIPDIATVVSVSADAPSSATWTVHRVVRTVSDMTVVTIGPLGQPAVAKLNLPKTDKAAMSSRRQKEVLEILHSDTRLGEWRALLPKLLADGKIDGQAYLVEQMLSGLDARQLLRDPGARSRILLAAASSIGELHRRTATSVVVDAEMLKRWIDDPLEVLQGLDSTRIRVAGSQAVTERLRSELHETLAGRTLTVSWVHGDYWPGNILVTPDGAALTGIVDWDLAMPDDLPCLDLLQLLVSTRIFVQRIELGDVMRALLADEDWTKAEHAILNAAQSVWSSDTVGMRGMLLLYWLRHVAANLTKSHRYGRNWFWIAKNVEGVLRTL